MHNASPVSWKCIVHTLHSSCECFTFFSPAQRHNSKHAHLNWMWHLSLGILGCETIDHFYFVIVEVAETAKSMNCKHLIRWEVPKMNGAKSELLNAFRTHQNHLWLLSGDPSWWDIPLDIARDPSERSEGVISDSGSESAVPVWEMWKQQLYPDKTEFLPNFQSFRCFVFSYMNQTVQKCLLAAESLNATSIAFPLIGTGRYSLELNTGFLWTAAMQLPSFSGDVPTELAISALLAAFENYSKNKPNADQGCRLFLVLNDWQAERLHNI